MDGYAEVMDAVRQHSPGHTNETGESATQAPGSTADRLTPRSIVIFSQ